jgi:hypothetical protein
VQNLQFRIIVKNNLELKVLKKESDIKKRSPENFILVDVFLHLELVKKEQQTFTQNVKIDVKNFITESYFLKLEKT